MQTADPAATGNSLLSLPLASLILSRLNVRHTERDAEIASLAEDIAARGLKQNLVVVPAHYSTGEAGPVAERSAAENSRYPWDHKWEVIAGGRRLQAMQLLLADGRLQPDHEVPCLIEDRAEAAETSLSENLHKVAMNPADEFAAFQTIVQQQIKLGDAEDVAIAYTARRFGVTVKHVQGRLRLASLCPEVLDALRSNAITLDVAKAYAGTSDHDLQRTVFNAVQKAPYTITAKDIRNRLRNVTCALDDLRLQFIGLDAYRAAGGRTEVELFMGTEGEERVVDVALLDKLAQAHGDPLAAAAAKAAGWKAGLFTLASAYTVKKPEGMALIYHSADQLSKTKRKQCIAVYGLPDPEVEEAVALQAYFEPHKAAEPIPARDWEAERRKHQRESAIGRAAARLALWDIEGVLQSRMIWPDGYVPPVEHDDDDAFMLVSLQVRVPLADLEAKREEAARIVDAVEAASAEAEA